MDKLPRLKVQYDCTIPKINTLLVYFFSICIGCHVIGFAGSDDKVKWLVDEVGFDKAYNYKTADWDKCLKEAAPNGVDCYFDNVWKSNSAGCWCYMIYLFSLHYQGRRSVVNNNS